MAQNVHVSSGVQELIDKLKLEGAAAGQQKANEIIKEAQEEASQIISKARGEAEKLLSEAYGKIETERSSSHEAIKVAFRDAELSLRSKFRKAFSDNLKRLVTAELEDKDFIKQLVLAIATMKSKDVGKAENIEINVPSKLFKVDEAGPHLSQEGKEKLRNLILGVSGQLLREGVDLKPSANFSGGIRVALVGQDIQIDLSDEAISNLLLKYILPRYRAIISGQE